MPVFELIEAKAHHCGQIVRALRPEQAEAMTSLGVSPHQHLRMCFDDSCIRVAWLIDGRLAAVAGVTGTMASSCGHIWIALSQEAIRFPVALVKEVRDEIRRYLTLKHELVTILLRSDQASIRFVRLFGFKHTRDVSDWGVIMRVTQAEMR